MDLAHIGNFYRYITIDDGSTFMTQINLLA